MTQAIALLALLQIKHMFADFYMQTPNMLRDRARYVHSGRAQHCAIHSAGSLIAMVCVGVPWGLLVAIAVIEGVVHYHIDFGKGRWSERLGHTPNDASYWRAFGFDQMLHQMTYVAMIWAVLRYA